MQQENKIYEQAANLVMDYPNNHTVRFETPKDEIIYTLKQQPAVLPGIVDHEACE